MDVVCHQYVCVQPDAGVFEQLAQVKKINLMVAIAPETGALVVPSLNDVDSDVRKNQASLARHISQTEQAEPG